MNRLRRAIASGSMAAFAMCGLGCPHGSGHGRIGDAAHDGVVAEGGAHVGADVLGAIGRAEDQRRAADVLEAWQLSADPLVRRRAIRGLARIAEPPVDATTDGSLLRALGDEDLEVVGWAAYGLGWGCKGREDEHVKALAAREVTLADANAEPTKPSRDGTNAPVAIVRAIGRCGGALAEGVLTGFLRAASNDAAVEEVAYALGSISSRHALTDETIGALVDRAGGDPASLGSAAALYPLGRLDRVPDAWGPRVLTAARAVLGHTSPLREFAVRALEKAGGDGALDLGRAVANADLDAASRAEGAHSLGRLGAPGHEAAANALARMVHDHALLEPPSLSSDTFNVLIALLEALGQDAPKSADTALYSLASLPIAAKETPGLSRRTITLRCAAAAALARAAYDAPVLAKCDPDPAGEAGERARLAALVRRPLLAERRKAFRALAGSTHILVREAVLEAVAQHPELEEAGRALLVLGLGAKEPGVVATAAQSIVQHPEHVLTLAASERRAALDPRAPPPSSHPKMDLPADVAAALIRALARPWHEDAVETVTSLLDAAVAVSLPEARASATRACTDANITLRDHAAKALRSLGTPQAACPAPAPKDAPASATPPLAHPVRVVFDIEGAKLAIVFEPELTPLAANRFITLARAGFYRGIVVHRVVPGYVVQFGDPGGDGYGGSGELLRCETSPVPFGPLDVGVALAGRDTGSSQVFVTLARYPKLDGDYARVGRAEGDWGAVAEGDVIEGVHVEE